MKILIVDDESLARERLAGLISQFPAYELIGQAGDGKTALRMIEEREPDVVLLDIRMPGVDGLQVARALGQLRLPPAIIFTTAYSEHALSAFDTIASGYLLKPIKKEKLADALQNAHRPSKAQLDSLQRQKTADNPTGTRSHIIANTREGQLRIPIDDVIYFLADQKYTTVHHLNGEVLIEESLRHLEQDLTPGFLRIHRKVLVNTSYIVGLERGDDQGLHGAQLTLRHCDDKLPVSRRRLAEIRRMLFKNKN